MSDGLRGECRECQAFYHRQWKAANSARNTARGPEPLEHKRCSNCKEILAICNFTTDRSTRDGWDSFCRLCNRAWNRRYREKNPFFHRRYRLETLAAYGSKCACCGETDIEFLTIDHVNGGGAAHRRSIGGARIYGWLKRMGYPKDGFRILCYNCNCSRGANGYCPHEKKEMF